MKKINGPFGSKIDMEGNLVFPEITKEILDNREEKSNRVILELEDTIKKSKFDKNRINKLKELRKDIEDLKLLEKLEKNIEHLNFLREQLKEIKNYRNKK